MSDIIKCIVPIVVLAILVIGAMSLFGGDSVDVKDVYLSNHLPHQRGGGSTVTLPLNSNSEDVASGVFKFSIVPNKDLRHITEIRLENVEIDYEGYDSDKYDSAPLKYKVDENDNGGFKATDALDKHYLYSFYFKFGVAKDGLNYYQNEEAVQSINHVKADIVIDTTTDSEVVIGHIDKDVSFQS